MFGPTRRSAGAGVGIATPMALGFEDGDKPILNLVVRAFFDVASIGISIVA